MAIFKIQCSLLCNGCAVKFLLFLLLLLLLLLLPCLATKFETRGMKRFGKKEEMRGKLDGELLGAWNRTDDLIF